jgi:glycerate kinase
MFGKELTQGLRYFQKTVDTLTKQEAGRGGAAGGTGSCWYWC